MDQIRRPATPQPAAPTQRTQSTPPAQENQAPNAPSEPKTDTASQSLGDDVNAVAEQSKNIKSDDMNDGSAADAILSDSNTNDTAQIKGLLARLTREIYGDDASKKVVDFLSKDKVRGPALNQELKDTIQNNKGNLEKLIDELSKKNKNLVNGQCDSGC
jgi:hypothetical protein